MSDHDPYSDSPVAYFVVNHRRGGMLIAQDRISCQYAASGLCVAQYRYQCTKELPR